MAVITLVVFRLRICVSRRELVLEPLVGKYLKINTFYHPTSYWQAINKLNNVVKIAFPR